MFITQDRMLLTSGDAAAVFGAPTTIDEDASLAAILRALVIENGESDFGEIVRKSMLTRTVSNNDSESVNSMNNAVGGVVIVETKSGYFPESLSLEGWEALDEAPYPVNKYLSQFTKTRVFINKDKQLVVVFVERRASQRWSQAFMSTLPRVLTWYFSKNLTPEQESFYTSISLGNKDVAPEDATKIFISYVDSVIKTVDLRSASLHKQLDGYEGRIRTKLLEGSRSRLASIAREISSHKRSLEVKYANYGSELENLKALENHSSEKGSRLFEFFDTHKQLTLLSTSDDVIEFGIAETLEYYDEGEFDCIIRDGDSYLYEDRETDEDMELLLTSIFSERKGVFFTNSVFTLNGMRYVNVREKTFIHNSLPHPHLYFFGCTGANDQYFDKYAESGDWDLGIEQAIAATKNLNFGDSTVVCNMVSWLESNKNIPCIYMGDDRTTLYSVNEFLKKIKE